MKKLAEFLQVIQAIATIGAIMVGGVWTYLLFVQHREAYPRLKIEHAITHLPLPDNGVLLVLDITHTNVGAVKLSLPSADIRIYELAEPPSQSDPARPSGQTPTGPSEFWEVIDAREQAWEPDELVVEPGESDTLHYEFVLNQDVGPLRIYSYFENPTSTDRKIGWTHYTLYDLRNHYNERDPPTRSAALKRSERRQ